MGVQEAAEVDGEPYEVGAFPVAGVMRRVRRIADMSQRELAVAARAASSTIGRLESGALQPSLALLVRVLAVAGLRLVVADSAGRMVRPMQDWDDTRDGAGRRYPSHLDTILDPEPGEWWGDVYGLMRPPETYHRDRMRREMQRARSQWEVRVAQYRWAPPPPDPRSWRWDAQVRSAAAAARAAETTDTTGPAGAAAGVVGGAGVVGSGGGGDGGATEPPWWVEAPWPAG